MKVSIAPDFEHLLPALADAELAQLEENCKADPKHERMPPVVLWKNHRNTIVDGHNQYKIRDRLRLKIKYAAMEFETRDDALRYALDVQFGRRNLEASQRAIAYAKLPRNSHGGDRKADQVANLPLDNLAEKAGVSARTMRDAGKVVDNAPAAIVKAVEQGKVKVSDAAAVADLPKREQAKALQDVESGKAKTLRGAAFDPQQLEKQPTRKDKPKKSGRPAVTKQDRTNAQKHLGGLIRALSAMGIYDEFEKGLSQIAARLKQI